VSSATFNYLVGHSLSIAFDQTVQINLAESDLVLQNLTTSNFVASSSMSLWYSGGTNPAVVIFPGLTGGVLPDGNYRVTLVGSQIPGANGINLDGDNNGSAGGNFTFDFFVLSGDANHDRVVNSADLAALAANWQAFPRNYSQGDFNYDFKVDIQDLLILANHYNQVLLAPPPPAMPLPASLSPIILRRVPIRVLLDS
jgi:hypothetical protein